MRNTSLEDVHTGDIKLDNKEMKKLMREITNKVYTFLKFSSDQPFMALMSQTFPEEWDKAELASELVAAKEANPLK